MLCTHTITNVDLTFVTRHGVIQAMDVKNIRLANLHRLLASRFNGVIARFAEGIGKDANQARFILYPEKPGGRWLGERLARQIERKLGLPDGYLDSIHNQEDQSYAGTEQQGLIAVPADNPAEAVAIAETGAEQMSPGSYSVVAEPNAKNPYNPSAATSLSVSGRKLVSRLERLEAAGAASPQMYRAIEALLTMAEQNNNQPPSAYDDIRKAIDRDD